MPDVVHVSFATQLLSFAVAMQFVAFLGVFWRGIFGMRQTSRRRPRWLFIPFLLGSGAGFWYAVTERDLLFGVAQCLGLFIGFCLLNSTRGEEPGTQFTGTRRERREAEREARRAAKRGESAGE